MSGFSPIGSVRDCGNPVIGLKPVYRSSGITSNFPSDARWSVQTKSGKEPNFEDVGVLKGIFNGFSTIHYKGSDRSGIVKFDTEKKCFYTIVDGCQSNIASSDLGFLFQLQNNQNAFLSLNTVCAGYESGHKHIPILREIVNEYLKSIEDCFDLKNTIHDGMWKAHIKLKMSKTEYPILETIEMRHNPSGATSGRAFSSVLSGDPFLTCPVQNSVFAPIRAKKKLSDLRVLLKTNFEEGSTQERITQIREILTHVKGDYRLQQDPLEMINTLIKACVMGRMVSYIDDAFSSPDPVKSNFARYCIQQIENKMDLNPGDRIDFSKSMDSQENSLNRFVISSSEAMYLPVNKIKQEFVLEDSLKEYGNLSEMSSDGIRSLLMTKEETGEEWLIPRIPARIVSEPVESCRVLKVGVDPVYQFSEPLFRLPNNEHFSHIEGYKLEKTGEETTCHNGYFIKTFEQETYPSFLTVQVNRSYNIVDEETKRVTISEHRLTSFSVPNHILLPTKKGDDLFQTVSIGFGGTRGGGHHVMMLRGSDEHWYFCNDGDVYRVSDSSGNKLTLNESEDLYQKLMDASYYKKDGDNVSSTEVTVEEAGLTGIIPQFNGFNVATRGVYVPPTPELILGVPNLSNGNDCWCIVLAKFVQSLHIDEIVNERLGLT